MKLLTFMLLFLSGCDNIDPRIMAEACIKVCGPDQYVESFRLESNNGTPECLCRLKNPPKNQAHSSYIIGVPEGNGITHY